MNRIAQVMNRIALVTVGDELLNGAVVDTSTSWLGAQLSLDGHVLALSISVLDDLAAISDAILTAIARADAVIITGGLGPTSDDLTRLGVARGASRSSTATGASRFAHHEICGQKHGCTVAGISNG